MLTDLYRHRNLVVELTRREFSGRYRGSFGGVAWAFVQPLFLLCVYTLAFGVVLQVRWSATGDTTEYALMLFAGLLIYNALAEVLNRAPMLITSNPNFVKKVVFPLELLPVVAVSTAMLHLSIGTFVWLIGHFLLLGVPGPGVVLVLVVLASFVPLLLGIGWLLAAVGVLVRDIQQFTGMLALALLFLSPIFYSIDTAPPSLRAALRLNPLTILVERFREVLVHGRLSDPGALGLYVAGCSIFAALALLLFRRLRPHFADMV